MLLKMCVYEIFPGGPCSHRVISNSENEAIQIRHPFFFIVVSSQTIKNAFILFVFPLRCWFFTSLGENKLNFSSSNLGDTTKIGVIKKENHFRLISSLTEFEYIRVALRRRSGIVGSGKLDFERVFKISSSFFFSSRHIYVLFGVINFREHSCSVSFPVFAEDVSIKSQCSDYQKTVEIRSSNVILKKLQQKYFRWESDDTSHT